MKTRKLLISVLILGTFVPNLSTAEPIAQASDPNSTLILRNEPCQLEAIANLPMRATWEENGKVLEACWGFVSEVDMVLFYREDKKIKLTPSRAFKPMVNS